MGEWLKPAVLKTVSGVTRSGVRIPLPPPCILLFLNQIPIDFLIVPKMCPSIGPPYLDRRLVLREVNALHQIVNS